MDWFLKNKSETRAVHVSWRNVSIDGNKARQALRKTCTSERRKTEMEKEIAKIIISNPHLYSQAIELTDPISQKLN